MKKYFSLVIISLFLCINLCWASNPIAIVTAVPAEANLLINHLQHKQNKYIHGVHYLIGEINRQPVVILIAGVGMINMAITSSQLITAFHPRFMILSGTAGGLSHILKVGDVILVKKAWLLNVGDQIKLPPSFPLNTINPLTHETDRAAFTTNSAMLKHALQITKNVNIFAHDAKGKQIPGKIIIGNIATTEHFPNTQADIEKMQQMKIIATAMETAAFLKVCWMFHTKCLAIRGISNLLSLSNHHNPITGWNQSNARLAANNAGGIVLQILKANPTKKCIPN